MPDESLDNLIVHQVKINKLLTDSNLPDFPEEVALIQEPTISSLKSSNMFLTQTSPPQSSRRQKPVRTLEQFKRNQHIEEDR